jgi:hypothetical protein
MAFDKLYVETSNLQHFLSFIKTFEMVYQNLGVAISRCLLSPKLPHLGEGVKVLIHQNILF